MKFLVDENLPRRFADMLRGAGHEAAHFLDYDLAGHPDHDAWIVARREGYVVVTYDADFSAIAVLSGDALPSVVLFRDQQRRPEHLAELLLENFDRIEWWLSDGAVVVFDRGRVRIRSLPIDPD